MPRNSMHSALQGPPTTPPASAGSGAAGPTGDPGLDAAIFASLNGPTGNRDPQAIPMHQALQPQVQPQQVDPYLNTARVLTGRK